MVLDALIKIKNEIDPTLTFRRSCREGMRDVFVLCPSGFLTTISSKHNVLVARIWIYIYTCSCFHWYSVSLASLSFFAANSLLYDPALARQLWCALFLVLIWKSCFPSGHCVGICGSCSMNIDGSNTLACIRYVDHATQLHLYSVCVLRWWRRLSAYICRSKSVVSTPRCPSTWSLAGILHDYCRDPVDFWLAHLNSCLVDWFNFCALYLCNDHLCFAALLL